MEFSIVEIIQSMLSPALMISACGLLILGSNNKYSMVVARIRALDDEIRKYTFPAKANSLSPEESARLKNLYMQVSKLQKRIWLIRNVVISYFIAVILFIVSCLLIGIMHLFHCPLHNLVFSTFLPGMIAVVSGAFFSIWEAMKGYHIIEIEVTGTLNTKNT